MRISFRTESDVTRGITAEQNIRGFRPMSAAMSACRVRLMVVTRHSGVDLAHGPSDCACVLHRRPYLRARVNGHSRNARLARPRQIRVSSPQTPEGLSLAPSACV